MDSLYKHILRDLLPDNYEILTCNNASVNQI
jgi:hypothetical protein